MADREKRYLFRKKQDSGCTLPYDAMIGEPFVNTYEGRMFFSGNSNGTYIPVCGQTNVFEVGSNVDFVYAKSGITTPYVDFQSGTTNPSKKVGRTFFDATENALSYYPYTPNMDVTLNIGQESLIRVYNNSGYDILNGQACHISGSHSIDGDATIVLAIASGSTTDDAVVSGIATHDILNGNHGFITSFGIVRDLSITDAAEGSVVYLSDSTPGGFVYSSDDLYVTSRMSKVGRVIRTGTSISSILVDIQNEDTGLSATNLERNIFEINAASTGIIAFSGISVNAIDNSKFDIGAVKGWMVDNITNPLRPDITFIDFPGESGITITNLLAYPVTYVGISGGTAADIVQQTSPFTMSQCRRIIKLGVVIHSNHTSVNAVNIQPVVGLNPVLQLYDFMGGLNKFNVTVNGIPGNIFSSNGANLKVNKTAGKIFSPGSNYLIDPQNPHIRDTSSGDSITFRYRLQDSTEYANTTDVDPNYYDNGGVLTAVPLNKFTTQRISLFESNLSRWQYGQNVYDSIDDAEASIPNESFIVEQNIGENGLVRAYLIVRQGATDLSNTRYAKFVTAGRWGLASETVPGNVHRTEILNNSSTGLRNGGKMTTATTTSFNISAGSGLIIDNTTDSTNPVLTEVIWTAKTGVTLTYLTADTVSFIMIDSSGNVSQTPLSSPPTQSDKRNKIMLGAIAHSNKSNITNIYGAPVFFTSPVNQFEDLTSAVGPFSIAGNHIGVISGTFSLQKSLGSSFMYGGQFQSDNTNPSVLTCPLISGSSTPQYPLVYSTGKEILGLSGYTIDHLKYDPSGLGSLSAVSNHYYSNHRIWHLPLNNLLVFQYGQAQYSTMADAVNGLLSEQYTQTPGLSWAGYVVAVLIVGEDATSLSDTSQVKLIPQSKFAGAGGSGGAIADTLQTAYNNSSQPEILTDSTRGSVDIRRGSAADTDNVLTIQDNASNINAVFRGNGYFSATTIEAGVIMSAGTDLYQIFSGGSGSVSGGGYPIQPGINTFTAGTFSSQTVNVTGLTIDNINVSGNSYFNSLSAETIYTHTISGMSPVNLNSVAFESGRMTGSSILFSAGTTTIAPLKFTSGDLLATTEPGAMEYVTDDLYFSISTVVPGVSYTSYYPPSQNSTYVKCNNFASSDYYPWFATDPTKSLINGIAGNGWFGAWAASSHRFHIDLGTAIAITRVYYENYHDNGNTYGRGVNSFSLWGSNSATAFEELTYAIDTGWEEITGLSQNTFDLHVASNVPDPKYITFLNSIPYRYYAFKFFNCLEFTGLRRLELQNVAGSTRRGVILNDGTNLTSGILPVATTNGRIIDSIISSTSATTTINGGLDVTGNTSMQSLSATSLNLTSVTSSTDFYVNTPSGNTLFLQNVVWRDEFPGSDWVDASGAAAPELTNYTIGGVGTRKYAFDGSVTEERLSSNFEIPHDYACGYPIEVHVHWRPSTTNTGTTFWWFDWSYDAVNSAPSAQTTLSCSRTVTASSQYNHFITSFGYLPSSVTYTLGSIINFNIRRTPDFSGDTYPDDAIFEQVALHVPVDGFGSRQIYIK